MISSLLVANRGEIACRILDTCRRLGIRGVAVYSEADAGARHVRLADEAVCLGPAAPARSYLSQEALLQAARRTGVQALHPGYGFLAENAEFARAVGQAGLIWVGPDPATIEAMGDKARARALAQGAGVPVVPGYHGPEQDDGALLRQAARLGFPLLVKAAAGGGGKGMRLVARADELAEALAGARREARQYFGGEALILERVLRPCRHIEVQIFGDRHGNLVHLGERDCSIQRRHQKILEESPAPNLPEPVRQGLTRAALAVAREVGYVGAGTVEFLVCGGEFYFLEMNTRLQVEHPVTEEITGLDLVEWQLRVAEGQPLPLRQEQIRLSGHAVEVRLYAEDPRHEFLPSTGPVRIWRTPSGARVDSGIDQGDRVGTHYDPLLAKILCSGAGRPQALARLARALEDTVLLGLTSNLDFLRELVSHPELAEGRTDTGFLERHRLDGGSRDSSSALLCAALAEWLDRPLPDWARGHWRNNPDGQPYLYRFETAEGQEVEVDLLPPLERGGGGTGPWQVMGRPVRLLERRGPDLALEVEGRRLEAVLVREGPHWWVQTEGRVARLGRRPLLPEPQAGAEAAGSLRAPMPGVVVAVLVEVGQRVEAGQPLLKLEAMKMEHTVAAAFPGRVEALPLRPGDRVQADDLLVVLSPDPVPPTPV